MTSIQRKTGQVQQQELLGSEERQAAWGMILQAFLAANPDFIRESLEEMQADAAAS